MAGSSRPTMAALLLCSFLLFLAADVVSAGEEAEYLDIAPAPSVTGAIHHGAPPPAPADNDGGNEGKGNLKPSQCPGECDRRCSKTHHKKPCLFFCNKCCAKCLCVPPGYYGNKETCPCYNNWKNKRGGPKCP